jgi:hypothetical protein
MSDSRFGDLFSTAGPNDALERARYEVPLPAGHEDRGIIEPIVAAMLKHAGGWDAFARDLRLLLRRAVDEVIDTPRTNRFTLAETEKTEKTYLGTKIEILFRSMLKLPKGRVLDLSVDGAEVDIKNTMGSNWSIPEEALSRACVLIRENEFRAICSVGLIVAESKYLNPGMNKDRKRTISAFGMQNIWWILRDMPYPPNFWEALPLESRHAIMAPAGGARRLAELFERVQGRPIARSTVADICQQDDPMKRIRRNGGARDFLAQKGIAILYAGYDRELVQKLGLPDLKKDEFISHKPISEEQRILLKIAGHID